jgi:hypothetical protein
VRTAGRFLLPAAILLAGCTGTYMSPLVSYKSDVEECIARGGVRQAGVKRPHLVDEGKGVGGLIIGSGGFACVEATVTVEGKVADPKVLMSDNRSFASAFVQSLSGYVFEPAEKDGVPVSARVVIPGTWPVKWSSPMDDRLLWETRPNPAASAEGTGTK